MEDALRSYPGTVRLVTGDRDPFFSVAQARRQASLAQRAELVALESVGHFPQLEAVGALADFAGMRGQHRGRNSLRSVVRDSAGW